MCLECQEGHYNGLQGRYLGTIRVPEDKERVKMLSLIIMGLSTSLGRQISTFWLNSRGYLSTYDWADPVRRRLIIEERRRVTMVSEDSGYYEWVVDRFGFGENIPGHEFAEGLVPNIPIYWDYTSMAWQHTITGLSVGVIGLVLMRVSGLPRISCGEESFLTLISNRLDATVFGYFGLHIPWGMVAGVEAIRWELYYWYYGR